MQKEGLEELVLHAGFDDSNHAGKTKGEIIVAFFLFIRRIGLRVRGGKGQII